MKEKVVFRGAFVPQLFNSRLVDFFIEFISLLRATTGLPLRCSSKIVLSFKVSRKLKMIELVSFYKY